MQNESSYQQQSTKIENVDEESSSSDSESSDSDNNEENRGPPRGSFWDDNSGPVRTPTSSRESRGRSQGQQEEQRSNPKPVTSETRQHSFVFMGGESTDQQQPPVFSPTDPKVPPSSGGSPPTVSAENELQILLLMLLAQVCALHDPTPRTFTVHVLELFERGILDRESIRFLFDYGLVPSLPSPVNTTINSTSPTKTQRFPSDTGTTTTSTLKRSASASEAVRDNQAAVVPYLSAEQDDFNRALRRSEEATAIRTHLAHHHSDSSLPTEGKASSPISLARAKGGSSSPRSSSWAAKHFPLSLSRYQREFREDRLVASGSFGQVFCATKLMDGRKYAVKKVIFSATGYSNDSVTQVVREVLCLAQCDHVHCVRYYNSWLEPSWMTGQNTSSAATIQQQEQQLLMDMERVSMNSDSDTEKTPTQRPKRPSRRFSFDNNGCGSDDDIFSYYNDDEADDSDCSEWTRDMSSLNNRRGKYGRDDFSDWGYSLDDSVVGRRSRNKNAGQHTTRKSPKQKQQPTAYKYQICMYIQMELCGSTTLADWIQRRNVTNPSVKERANKALVIFRQICNGLAHVHSKSILHRDLKPANIFRSLDDEEEHFKIGDFGLAKSICTATQTEQRSVFAEKKDGGTADSTKQNTPVTTPTQSLAIVAKGRTLFPAPPLFSEIPEDPQLLTAGIGTASYAAPEQIQSRSYGPEADIFSMGLILLELFCCFGTQHERFDTFQDCRRGKAPPWMQKEYPCVASAILACCSSSPKARPTAQELLNSDLWSALSDEETNDRDNTQAVGTKTDLNSCANETRQTDDTVQKLESQLKDHQVELESQKLVIAEKDRVIDNLRREMEKLKMGAVGRNGVGGERIAPVAVDPSAALGRVKLHIADATESNSSEDEDY